MSYKEDKRIFLENLIINNRIIISLLFVYFFLHLLNLTLLPPYNDESIYLDWAWSYTHMPGHLYDSLLDAKQPLTIWLFGLFENFFADPLFAGRLVSVLIGSATLVGIYKLAKQLFDSRVAFFSALLFAITPIFVFYNRQALMEAGVTFVGMWAFYFLQQLIDKSTNRQGMLLGFILGVGFLIKSSTLLFIVAATLILLFYIFKKRRGDLIRPSLISLITLLCVNVILFINPIFWQTFSSNNRYSYTLAEYLAFPIQGWITHFSGFFEIGFFFVTPFVFLCSFVGMYMMKKKKVAYYQLFLIFFIIALGIEIFSGRYQNQRYLVPFLPFLIICASYVLANLWQRVLWEKMLVFVTIAIPFVSSVILVVNPDYYITQMAKLSHYSNVEHVRGQMSGYGIKEVMEYIKTHSISSQPTLVFFALNAGNPESAIDVYSNKDPQLYAFHIDAQFFPGINQYQCLKSEYPAFFVTRYDQRVGLDRYFVLEKSFLNPDSNYSIGIYSLKKDCKGNTASLSDFYQGAMNKIWEIRSDKSIY